MAAIATKFEAKNAFEAKLQKAADRAGVGNDKQVMEKEKKYLETLDPVEAEQ